MAASSAGEDHGDDQLAPARVDPIAHEALEQPALVLVEGERDGCGLDAALAAPVHDGAFVLWSSGSSRRCMWTTK